MCFWQILNRLYEEERIEELDAGLLFRSSLEALGLVVDDALQERAPKPKRWWRRCVGAGAFRCFH